MLATVTCPICGHKQSVPEGKVGRRVLCPNCDVPFVAGASPPVEPKPEEIAGQRADVPGPAEKKTGRRQQVSQPGTGVQPPLLPGGTFAPSTTTTDTLIRIGRAPDNDVVLDYPMISAYHAEIAISGGKAVIRDLASSNGTALGHPESKIAEAPLQENDIVYFGSYSILASRLLAARHVVAGNQSQDVIDFPGQAIVFGRDPTCDHVLNFPMVSARHARLVRGSKGLIIEDLGSTNGTFLNGRQVTIPATVKPGDTIGFGTFTFILTDAGTLQIRDLRGNVTIEARSVSVNVHRKQLIEDVSLVIQPSEFVGLMGPSGAGKTTLMNAMNGYTCPSSGGVLLNGYDLYANYGRFSTHIGYVPQDDIIHRDLTVGQALYFSCRLRLPPDFTKTAIEDRIRAVLCKLGLEGTENVLIGSPEKKGISGGERKRVNLAMELLTDPLVLFLDEPTSGLSSEDALLVMKLLRNLANEGKTILLTIHQPSLEVFRLMDNLAVLAKDASTTAGKLVFYGPAFPDAITFFSSGLAGPSVQNRDLSPNEILRSLAKDTAKVWAERFEASAYHKAYVRQRQAAPQTPASERSRGRLRQGPLFDFLQWRTLVARLIAIKIKDTWNSAIVMLQAPVIAFVIVLVWGDQVREPITTPENTGALAATVFMMGLAALWFGCSNAVREIVGEWAVYRRERMVNLTIPAYVASKFTVLAGLCIIQCAVLLLIIRAGCALKGPWLATFVLLLLAALVGVAVSLVISAASRTTEMAIALVPVVLLPMILLGGMVQSLPKMGSTTKTLCHAVPSRWAFEGMLLLESAKREKDVAENYFPKKDHRHGLLVCPIVLFVMLVLLVSSVGLILRWRDIHK